MINPKIIDPLINDYIIDKGSNSYGNYIKYKSGRLVQYGKNTTSSSIQTPMGNVYRTANEVEQRYPIPFVRENPYLITQARASLNSFYVSNESLISYAGYPIAYISISGGIVRWVYWLAIGYWK